MDVTEKMELLLPDQLKAAWQAVEANTLSLEEFNARQQSWTEAYRDIWKNALAFNAQSELTHSLLTEIAHFTGESIEEVKERCKGAVKTIGDEWDEHVNAESRESIERYYDQNEGYIYDLMWWHALQYDDSPLAYVTALDFAQRRTGGGYLDFGSGVGAGALLFAKHGFTVTLADISSTLLTFCRWRFAQRSLPARFIDLKESKLPDNAFEIVTAMDVFEHLVDPIEAIDQLYRALKPGGLLIGRFAAEKEDRSHPQHIVHDFERAFSRLSVLGFKEVWRDEWLWGHQAFQKPPDP